MKFKNAAIQNGYSLQYWLGDRPLDGRSNLKPQVFNHKSFAEEKFEITEPITSSNTSPCFSCPGNSQEALMENLDDPSNKYYEREMINSRAIASEQENDKFRKLVAKFNTNVSSIWNEKNTIEYGTSGIWSFDSSLSSLSPSPLSKKAHREETTDQDVAYLNEADVPLRSVIQAIVSPKSRNLFNHGGESPFAPPHHNQLFVNRIKDVELRSPPNIKCAEVIESNNTEDLLTSIKTHFQPIKQSFDEVQTLITSRIPLIPCSVDCPNSSKTNKNGGIYNTFDSKENSSPSFTELATYIGPFDNENENSEVSIFAIDEDEKLSYCKSDEYIQKYSESKYFREPNDEGEISQLCSMVDELLRGEEQGSEGQKDEVCLKQDSTSNPRSEKKVIHGVYADEDLFMSVIPFEKRNSHNSISSMNCDSLNDDSYSNHFSKNGISTMQQSEEIHNNSDVCVLNTTFECEHIFPSAGLENYENEIQNFVCDSDYSSDSTSIRPCSFFLEGTCKRSDCKFSHDLRKITCKFWEEGFCFKGDLCEFLHGYHRYSNMDDNKTNPRFVIESEADFPSLENFPLAKGGYQPERRSLESENIKGDVKVVFKSCKKKGKQKRRR